MFFILSKTLYYLVLPVTVITILFIISLLAKRKRTKQQFLIITFVCFYIFSNNFLANTLLKAWELDPVPYGKIDKTYDFGIVLTGVLQNKKKPYDRPYFDKGADRVFHTFQLYKKGVVEKILISGGSGKLINEGYKEADELRKVFITMGVLENDLITESESRNTAESADNIATLIKGRPDLLLITSAFHMRRARDSFSKQGLDVDVFPVDYYTDTSLALDSYIIPSHNGINKWTRLIHEVVGYVAYDLVGFI